MSYPNSADSIPNVPANTNLSGPPDHTALHNQLGVVVEALETKLGTGASTPVEGEVLTGTSTGSVWSALPPPSGSAGGDLTGTYPNPTLEDTSNVQAIIAENNPAATFTTNGTVKQTVYNVRDYGAVGDGSTDDTTAIQSAFTAMNTAGGGILYFSPGTYVTTGLVFVGSNFIVEGAGESTIFYLKNGSNTDCICLGDATTSCNNVTFRDFMINGNQSNQSAVGGHENNGLRLRGDAQNCYFVTTERVYSYNNLQHGISYESPYMSSIINCRSENNYQNGVWWENSSLVTVRGCQTKNNGNSGIIFFSCDDGSMVNNTSWEDQGQSFSVQNTLGITVIGNKSYRAGYSTVAAKAIYASISSNLTIVGNSTFGSYGHGMYLNGVTYSTISNNTFKRNGQLANNTYADVYFDDSGGGSTVSNNIITNNTFQNDTPTNYSNAVAYNMQGNRSGTHLANVIENNQFGSPVTSPVLNLVSTSGKSSTLDNYFGTNSNLNPHGYYYYGFMTGTPQIMDWANGDTLYGVGYNTNLTLNIPNGLYTGQKFTFIYNQDVGNKQITWGSNVQWPGGIPPVFSGVADTIDIMVFTWDGSFWNGNWGVEVPVSISNGGTGSTTKSFVDLTTNQTVAGNKTFTGTTIATNVLGVNRITPSTDAEYLEFTDGLAFDYYIGRAANSDALSFSTYDGSTITQRASLTTGGAFAAASFTGAGTGLTGTAAGLTAGSVTNATLTTALIVNTGTLTLTANAANTSILTIGAGVVSVSGSNTGDQTNISGNAATVTTNANLTGPITSSGNATSIASQTGTGTKFVMDTSPTLVTPILGVATGTGLILTGSSANILTAGLNGSANPAFNVDASTVSSVTGISIKSAAAGGGVTLTATSSATSESLTISAKSSGTLILTAANGISITQATKISSTSPNGFAVGPNGTTNPTLNVNGNTASAVTGLNIIGAASGAGLALAVISSGSNESGTLDGLGTGTFGINTRSATSGLVTIGNSTSLAGLKVNGPTTQVGNLTLSTYNLVTDTTTGTQIGTATNQKLAYYGATPIVQPGATTDLGTVLSNLGLRASGTAYPITTTAAVSVGNLTLGTAGNKLNITTGSNASAGTGTLVGGTVTISTTAVTANSLIFLQDTSSTITNVGTLTVSAKSAGVGFTVTSTVALDTSTFNWLIIN